MTHHPPNRQRRMPVQFSKWPVTLACCLALSGCQFLPSAHLEEVRQPPLIPEPATTDISPDAAQSGKTTFIGVYADLSELEDASHYHPMLKEAVRQALQSGILKPASLQERFDPGRPIGFGEFRRWALAYQSVISGAGMMPVETPSNTDKPVKELASFSKMPGGELNPMSPQTLMVLPASMSWENHTLSESRPLTRQELCALYVFLSQQDMKARALTMEQIESANPHHPNGIADDMGMDEALSQFKDYTGIAPWAKRYVALSYQDGMLQKTFRLTPNQLTVDTGFAPTREVTRAEALMLLHSLYGNALTGKTANKAVTPKPDTKPPALPSQGKTTALPNSNTTTAATDKTPTTGHLQTIQESGPQGSRSAIRVSGPE